MASRRRILADIRVFGADPVGDLDPHRQVSRRTLLPAQQHRCAAGVHRVDGAAVPSRDPALPARNDAPAEDVLAIGASGALYMGALFFYLQALRLEEASVIAIFFQATPLFAYALGYLVLGKRPSELQIVGGLLIIAGVALLSYGSASSAVRFRARTSTLMVTCALSAAVSSECSCAP